MIPIMVILLKPRTWETLRNKEQIAINSPIRPSHINSEGPKIGIRLLYLLTDVSTRKLTQHHEDSGQVEFQ